MKTSLFVLTALTLVLASAPSALAAECSVDDVNTELPEIRCKPIPEWLDGGPLCQMTPPGPHVTATCNGKTIRV